MGPELQFIVPGPIDTATGGYRYDRAVVHALRAAGHGVGVHELGGGWPEPDARAVRAADALLGSLPDGTTVVVDGLAFGALPDVAARHAKRLDLVALVHHPLHLEPGATAERLAAHRIAETRALGHARRTIVTSERTARDVAAMGLAPDDIRVVAPGTEPASLARGSDDGTCTLLCVATVTPRKDHATLVEALARVADRPWRLICVGDTARDAATSDALRRRIRACGLEERVELTGELGGEALAERWDAADAFVLASLHEGHGMVLDEAIAHGLPIVATRGGAMARTVPPEAGLLVAPGDVPALASTLGEFLDDARLRARLRDGARRARDRRRDWDVAAAEFADAVGTAAAGGPR